MDAYDSRFPMACPICKSMSGTPHRVTTQRDTLTLDLVCGACHHEWQISALSPNQFLRARTDRRRSPRRE